jgi:predicted nucleic acid-binding protein
VNVVVDSPIWSKAFRRSTAEIKRETRVLRELVLESRAQIIGAVRQEVLSGIRHARQFQRLRQRLRAFPDLDLKTADFETAAKISNECRSHGIQGSGTDFLICAAAFRRGMLIYTSDLDFDLYAEHVDIRLFHP